MRVSDCWEMGCCSKEESVPPVLCGVERNVNFLLSGPPVKRKARVFTFLAHSECTLKGL